jgi:hypothetical protein
MRTRLPCVLPAGLFQRGGSRTPDALDAFTTLDGSRIREVARMQNQTLAGGGGAAVG